MFTENKKKESPLLFKDLKSLVNSLPCPKEQDWCLFIALRSPSDIGSSFYSSWTKVAYEEVHIANNEYMNK